MIISKTPLRISFAGGGSDLREYYKHGHGCVLSATIDKFVYITVNSKFTDHVRVSYSKTEYVDDVNEIEHNLVREALKCTGVTRRADVVYMSDMLPAHEGSGLGASSSLLVGTLNALYAYKGRHVSAEHLAQEACGIEIDLLGNPIGKQDQYAAAYGGLNYIQFNDDVAVVIHPVIMKPETMSALNETLLLFFTGLSTRSDEVLVEQKKKTKDNLHVLDKMIELCKELREALQQNDVTEFGNILHKGWTYKKELASKVTNATIDRYYEKARQAGAIGGKILGSGGGGFLLLYCEKEHQDSVRQALSDLKEAHISFEYEGSRIIYVSE